MKLSLTRGFYAVAAAAVAVVSSGCIPVDDLGNYWGKGITDPELEGHWRKLGVEFRFEDEYLSFLRRDDHYAVHHVLAADLGDVDQTPLAAKTLRLGEHSFLMFGERGDDAGTVSGGLQRYSLDGDTLTLHYLDLEVLQDAIEAGQVAGRVPARDDPDVMDLSPPTIAKLDERSTAFIAALADEARHWGRVERYERIADLDEALRVSRTYPATPDTPRNTLVSANLPDLAYFAEGRTGLLRRHLQATPEWKVSQEAGQAICYEREREDGQWKVSLHGYRSAQGDAGEWTQTRRVFRFAPEGGGVFASDYHRSYLRLAGALEGPVHLNLRLGRQGIESYLAVGAPGLWFEVFEQSQQEPRTHTREALQWLEGFLRGVRAGEREIVTSGFVSGLMPAGATRAGKPVMAVEDSFQGGIYDVSAWANPGQSGYVYLKAYNVETGERLSEEQISERSNEAIGWSDAAEQLFFYNAHITVYEGDWEHFYDARFELWFRPDDGGPERQLVETTRSICGWQR